MALLTLSKLLDAVLDEIPGKEQAPIVRAANNVIRRIQTEFVEPVRSTFTTKAKLTTGTVSVTQDSTTATFSGSVLSASDPVMLFQAGSDATWFVMTYSNGTTGILSSPWAIASNATATYTVVYPTVSFPVGVAKVIKIQREGFTPLDFRIGGSYPQIVGTPTAYSPYYHDAAAATPSDDLLRYNLDPAPDQRIVFAYWYEPRTNELDTAGATSQVMPLPDVWNEAIIQGTLFHCWKQEAAKEKALLASALYEAAMTRARGAADNAKVLNPRNPGRGLYAYEERPIGSTP